MLIGVESELIPVSLWRFDNDPQQLLVVGIERLEATWVCKAISSCSFTLFFSD
jgi:hypothetical protein